MHLIEFPLFFSMISIVSGGISLVVVYAFYRKVSLSVWAWIDSLAIGAPSLTIPIASVESLYGFLLLAYLFAFLVLPVLVAVANILLIQLDLARRFSWLPWPKIMDTIRKADRIITALEKGKAIPRPSGVKRLFYVSMLCAAVHLAVFLAAFYGQSII